jgi:hypothetical protein
MAFCTGCRASEKTFCTATIVYELHQQGRQRRFSIDELVVMIQTLRLTRTLRRARHETQLGCVSIAENAAAIPIVPSLEAWLRPLQTMRILP